MVTGLDGCIQVTLVALTVVGDDGGGFLIGQVLDALLASEVELHPDALVLVVNQGVSVT